MEQKQMKEKKMATESINKRLILASGHGFYERHSLSTSITWEKRAQKKKTWSTVILPDIFSINRMTISAQNVPNLVPNA